MRMSPRSQDSRPSVLTTVFATAAAGLSLTFAPAAHAQTASEPDWLTAIRQGRVRHSREDRVAHTMGALPASESTLARSRRFVVRDEPNEGDLARPTSLLLTDYLPPVQSQGQQGSCVGWSSAYYCYTYAVSKQRHLSAERIAVNDHLQFSPAFVYHLGNGGRDNGMAVPIAFQILHDRGCASLNEMPYDAGDFTTPPGDSATEHAARYKAVDTGLLFRLGEADPEKLKIYLAEARQPFVTSIPILTDFPQGAVDGNTVYAPTVPPSRENVKGLHAITIVGYDDSRHAFRMVNSWGPHWGDHGFLWLDEDFIRACAIDGCSLVAGGIASRDPAGNLRVGPHVSLTAGESSPRLRPRSVRPIN